MQYNQHGDFALRWVGDVLHVSYFNVWNEQCSHNLAQEAKVALEARQGKSFALFNDLRYWEGVTPKAKEIWLESFFRGCADRGMKCSVSVMPTEFHSLMVADYTKIAVTIVPQKMCVTLQEGCDWLNTQGFPVEQGQFLEG